MPPTSSLAAARFGLAGYLTTVLALVGGCASSPPPPGAPVVSTEGSATHAPADWIRVVRYGRYTLVELVPTAEQRNLLEQVVEVSIPSSAEAVTVGEGLRHVLRHTGYRLCEASPAEAALFRLPLPAAHRHLGPLILREALLTLAGPAWELQVDDVRRVVCFVQRPAEVAPPPVSPGSADDAEAQP
ncbi:hypothetical protein BZL41_26465 [Pseudomonas sp. PIC25]|uniref:PFGI-1 class ICE element type IV pilus protein PilL2 n=1 Tax=Pseudomonas sp. PIC25 TaxID=1958773 RepID=UPI000BABA684|nr:PilL N-terminal domain-containing protein [Pseudomonas sp. PIC25]PAU51975.1 hypothetical protein BZL41_26465 [Pseudomonas sp. PIC25]